MKMVGLKRRARCGLVKVLPRNDPRLMKPWHWKSRRLSTLRSQNIKMFSSSNPQTMEMSWSSMESFKLLNAMNSRSTQSDDANIDTKKWSLIWLWILILTPREFWSLAAETVVSSEKSSNTQPSKKQFFATLMRWSHLSIWLTIGRHPAFKEIPSFHGCWIPTSRC